MTTKSKGRLLGYARVSTNGQELQLQTDALLKAGVTKKLLFVDKVGRLMVEAVRRLELFGAHEITSVRASAANNPRAVLNAQLSNRRAMKKLTPALVVAVFAFNCWFAWTMLTVLLEVRDTHHRLLPYFTNLCVDLRQLLVVFPIVAAAYGLWLCSTKQSVSSVGNFSVSSR